MEKQKECIFVERQIHCFFCMISLTKQRQAWTYNMFYFSSFPYLYFSAHELLNATQASFTVLEMLVKGEKKKSLRAPSDCFWRCEL